MSTRAGRAASREMDAEVARALGEKGRVVWYAQAPGRTGSGWDFSDYRHEVEEAIADKNRRFPDSWAAGSTVESVTHYPRYSEDIAAAWLVVERMRERGFMMGLAESEEGGWGAMFVPDAKPDDGGWEGEGATAPLAIVNAALHALAECGPTAQEGEG